MDKLIRSTVITLLLLVDAQAHAIDHQEIKSSTLGADISFASSRTIANVEDPVPDAAEISSSSHDASVVDAIRGKMLRSNIDAVAWTFNSSASAAVGSPVSSASSPELLSSSPCDEEASSFGDGDAASSSSSRHEDSIAGDIEPTAACSRSNSDSIFVSTAAAVAPASSSDVTTSDQHTARETTTFHSISDGSSYIAGTVEPKQEQDIVESTSLAVSALPRQGKDSARTAYISTSTHAGNEAISPDRPASSTNEGNDTSGSNSSLFYSFLVLGIAGLVSAVLVYSIKRRVTAKGSIMTPTSPAPWTPPPSEVHVVMRSRNVVVL